jgi:hypothetical protein
MHARFLWLFGLALTSTIDAFGQSKRGPREGVWQVAEVTHRGPEGSMTSKPGPNLTISPASITAESTYTRRNPSGTGESCQLDRRGTA